MAIFHMNCGMVSRSSGRSSVQSAAYITGEKLSESRRGIVANYQNRVDDVAAFNTLIPDHSDRSFADLSVWDKLEKYEDKYAIKRFPNDLIAREKFKDSAQTAMTVVCALPRELSPETSIEMVEDFAKNRFVSRGLIVTYAIHKNEGNPHVHYQISRRRLEEDNTFSWTKDRDICLKSSLLETRKLWADTVNSYLEREGFDLKITEKSFLDLGIKLEPEKHRGWVSDKLADMGIDSRIVKENRNTYNRNRSCIIENPEIILNELTTKNATFTQNNLLKLIQKRVGDDDKVITAVFEKALAHSLFVGRNKHAQNLYTSRSYKELEDKTYASLNQMRRTQIEQSDYGLSVDLDAHLRSEKHDFVFSDNQKEAMIGLIKPHQLSVLIGRAGSGKTTILKPVCAAYQAQNHTVIGGSLSALAASQLGAETGIETKTLHAWLHVWREYQRAEQSFLSFNSVMEEGLLKQLGWYQTLQRLAPYKLSKKHVFVLDEAGMVGADQWSELLHFVQKTGCKTDCCWVMIISLKPSTPATCFGGCAKTQKRVMPLTP
jgi:ATP-dependent exoDNAse (exonuclease V) alpha subunit